MNNENKDFGAEVSVPGDTSKSQSSITSSDSESKSKILGSIYKKRAKNKRAGSIRAILRSSDVKVLDECVANLVSSIHKIIGSTQVLGPLPLPKKKKVWTVLTSPHIDKRARQQFERFVRTRMIEFPASKKVMDAIDGNSIPASVEIEVKT
ncbi:MAG: hypothetical protein H6845_01245 [Alphaproteobacteria bacterium]|nr:MAG: hypothetical protein H6845_01245 [Alphaproteobacteria bacterium]